MITRPAGAFLVFGAVGYLLHYHWSLLGRRRFARAGVTLVLLVLCFMGGNLMLQDWDFMSEHKLGNIVTYANTLEGTYLDVDGIRTNAEGLKFPPSRHSHLYNLCYFMIYNPWQFISTGGQKLLYLLTGYRPYYSVAHNAYILFWISLVYAKLFIGWRRVFPSPLATYAICVAIATCGLVTVSTVDWDNRFYIPLEPAVVLVAGMGISDLLTRLRTRYSRRAGLNSRG
jgi:hypothetical protein